ncbi:MAG: hypothetical protein QXE32_03060 [Sulfolobales archaeon]
MKLKRVIISLVLLILFLFLSIFYMISVYKSYYTYTSVDLDGAYYSYIENGKNSSLSLGYYISFKGSYDNLYISSSSVAIAYISYDRNASVYNVYWTGDPVILQKILIGQNSRSYYRVISLADIFYNISSQSSNIRALEPENIYIDVENLRNSLGWRTVIPYNISLDNNTIIYIYVDAITMIPVKIDIESQSFNAEAFLVIARAS